MSQPENTLPLESRFTPYLKEDEIRVLVADLAEKIRKDYDGKTLLLVGVLKGAYVFLSDLIRELRMDVEIDFVRLSSYGKERESSGTVTLLKDISRDIRGKHVLIVEEIVDSGRSLKFLYDRLSHSGPASLEIVTLLDKHEKRVVNVPVKYSGKKVEDQFLIGYGLDLEERVRNCPSILALTYPN
ncbi:MAG: hypoxanthine phosphoribosyltransferase [Bdellovibrionales bacterium]|nr:hypoxanthine phosphoribosyltransferase [Bdellovibrionales bacterium]